MIDIHMITPITYLLRPATWLIVAYCYTIGYQRDLRHDTLFLQPVGLSEQRQHASLSLSPYRVDIVIVIVVDIIIVRHR